MGAETAISAKEAHYQSALDKIEMIAVLQQPEDIVNAWKEAAQEMRLAQDYKDASGLAADYERRAGQAEKEGKEMLYQKALRRMEREQEDANYILAAQLFRRIGDYRDSAQKAVLCDEKAAQMQKKLRKKNTASVAAVILAVLCLILLMFWMDSRTQAMEIEGEYGNEIVVCDTAGIQ